MSNLKRDAAVWAARIRECRNPLLWLSAIDYDRQRMEIFNGVLQSELGKTANYLREIEDDAPFIADVRDRLARWTAYKPRAIDFMMSGRSGSVFFNEVTLYAIVRVIQPDVVIETGGTPGKSTAFILRAMERNNKGHLYTIDLPPQNTNQRMLTEHGTWHQALPQGLSSGWVVPEVLRDRNTLYSGKSSEHLPALLAKLDKIDIFLHDSDHSYENMVWEFETAWPAIKPGGIVLSDDVLANSSFFDFCRRKKSRARHVFNLGATRRS